MKTLGTITIALEGKYLGRIKVKNEYAWGRNRHSTTVTPTATADVITESLAVYKIPKERSSDDQWYHVIHIPTGFVIASVGHGDLGMVKRTFESIGWTLKNGNELHATNLGFPFHMVCKLAYTIIKEENNNEA